MVFGVREDSLCLHLVLSYVFRERQINITIFGWWPSGGGGGVSQSGVQGSNLSGHYSRE